jgi:hypothetical protein
VELIIAIISAVVAVSSAIVAIVGQHRITVLQHQLAQQQELQSREAKAEALLAKYRDPLLRAAFDLQSRLFSTVQLGFLRIYYNKSDADQQYAEYHTLYALAEYFDWVEVVRREVQFLDLGDIAATRRLQELLQQIMDTLNTDGIQLNFRLFRGEQRAIGELMLAERNRGEGTFFDCIGFAEFTQKIDNPNFTRWFGKLKDSIKIAATDSDADSTRLIRVQHGLVDLIDFLDLDCIRIPSKREKITHVLEI